MKRPMLFVLVYLLMGIVAGIYFNYAIYIALLMVIATVLLYLYRRLKLIFMLPLVALIGCYAAFFANMPANTELENLAKDERNVTVSGRVTSIVRDSESEVKYFLLDGRAFESDGEIIEADVRLKVYSDEENKLTVGDMAVAEGELVPPTQKTNPSDFDMRSYMLARHQSYIMYADKVSVYGSDTQIDTALQALSDKAMATFYTVLPDKEAAIMCGMLLGDSALLDSDTVDLYRKTGIYHVLAISGLHIMLLGCILLKLLSFLKRRYRGVVVTLFLICYCILTGCSVSAVRAVIMFGVLTAGALLFCEYDIVSSAAFTAVILLVTSPFYIFDVGFQFSFAAVFAIGFTSDAFKKYGEDKRLNEKVAVSVSADLATKVISMLHYYYINLWSIAANFLLVPMMSVAAVLGLAVIVSGFFCIGLASAIALPLLLLLRIVEVWCKFFVSLPLSYIVTGRPQLWALVAMAVLCLAVYRLAVQRRFRLTSAVTALAVYTIVIAVNKYTLRLAPTSVNFLDVGQGDCAVGIGKDYCFVVDGGGLASDSTKSGKGKRVLLPYLLYNGIDGVNAVFISHSDNDHAGGISEIIGGVDIGAIYVSEDCEKNSLYYDILDKADSNGVSVLEMAKGDVLKLSKVNDDCMECIYSGESKDIKSNDNSLVTRYKCEYGSVLFTGDIEAETELDICENNDVSADILKLAHHGSKTSSTEEFLKAVNPLAAVISAKKSVYGHPSEEVTDRLAELKIPYFVTESSGEVSFSFDKDGIKESSYKEDR